MDYDKILLDLKVEEGLGKEVRESVKQALNSFAGIPEKKTEEENLDGLLETLTREYHRSTGY